MLKGLRGNKNKNEQQNNGQNQHGQFSQPQNNQHNNVNNMNNRQRPMGPNQQGPRPMGPNQQGPRPMGPNQQGPRPMGPRPMNNNPTPRPAPAKSKLFNFTKKSAISGISKVNKMAIDPTKIEDDEELSLDNDLIKSFTPTQENLVEEEIEKEGNIQADKLEKIISARLKKDEDVASKIKNIIDSAYKREDSLKKQYEDLLVKAQHKSEAILRDAERKSQRMRKAESKSRIAPHSLLFFIGVGIIVASWFIPQSTLDPITGAITTGDPARIGVGWVFQAFGLAFTNSAPLIVFLFAIAGFMGVTLRTGALQALMKKIINWRRGNEITIIPLVMIMIAVASSTINLSYGLIPLATIIIPFFILAGFDVITGIMVILFGWAVGIMGSTINPFTSGAWNTEINKYFEIQGLPVQLAIKDGVWLRSTLLAIYTGFASLIVMSYGKLVLHTVENSRAPETTRMLLKSKNEILGISSDGRISFSRFLILFVIISTLLVNAASVIPWTAFDIHIFEHFKTSVIENDFGRFFFGSMPALGNWTRVNIAALFMMSTVLIGVISGMGIRVLSYAYVRGVNQMTSTIIIVIIGAMILSILNQTNIHVTMINNLFGLIQNLDGFLVSTASVGISSIFSPLFPENTNIYPVIAQSVGNVAHGAGTSIEYIAFIGAAINTGLGVAGPILPTSVITIVILDQFKISFGRWARIIGPSLAILFLVGLISISVLYIFVK